MPMHRERYPSNWDEISLRIRERAGNKCEQCGVPNHALIYRPPEAPEKWVILPDPISQDDVYRIFGGRPISEMSRVVKIVLTVHHIGAAFADGTFSDPDDKMDCRDENLIALCQRCHFHADAHAKRAVQRWRIEREQKKRTRKTNPNQLSLFGD